MYAQVTPYMTIDESVKPTVSRPVVIAVILGLVLGMLITLAWPAFTGLAALAMWPLGLGISCLVVGLVNGRQTGSTHWGLIFGGQLLGTLALALLLLAWLN